MTPRIKPVWFGLALWAIASGCYVAGWDTASPAPATPCVPLQQFFSESLWQPVMADQCVSCHIQGGQAGSSALVLDPNDTTASFWATRSVARMTAADGNSLLMAELSGTPSHPPPAPMDANSAVFLDFAQFSRRALSNDLNCP